MRQVLSLTLLFSLLSVAICAQVGPNRYSQGLPHSGNSLHRGYPGPNTHLNHRSGHYGGPSAYQPPKAPLGHYQAPRTSYGTPSHFAPQQYPAGPNNNYKRNHLYQSPQAHGTYQQDPKPQTQGREMKYTIRDPHNKGTTHVTETHVVSNRQMKGAEAEAAMKQLMGSMGPGPSYDNGFQDFVKDMGLPFY